LGFDFDLGFGFDFGFDFGFGFDFERRFEASMTVCSDCAQRSGELLCRWWTELKIK
jgi:hypothetical protein